MNGAQSSGLSLSRAPYPQRQLLIGRHMQNEIGRTDAWA
jgi:hypothetical protein